MTDDDWSEVEPVEEPEREFADLDAFVCWLTDVYRRESDTCVWCPRWVEHAEARLRLQAIWDAYEEVHSTPSGLSSWWLGHLDPHMRVLLSRTDGPFSRCRNGEHDDRYPLEALA